MNDPVNDRAARVGARTWPRLLGRTWPTALWLIALLVCQRLRTSRAGVSAALWGLLLLTSFVTWGAIVLRRVGDERRFGWGFESCLGMAVTLWVFGALACVRLVSVPAIVVWTTAGPLLFGWERARRGDPASAQSPPSWMTDWRAALRKPQAPLYALGLGLLLVVAGLRYANAVMYPYFNPWDDNMAYRSFIRQFLDTGTLTDGFSFRRVGAYGGISLLQAMVLAMSDRDRVHMMDNGICLLTAFGLITGYRGSARSGLRMAPVLVAGLLLLTLPYYLHNLGGEISGLAFFLALFRLYDDPGFETASPRSNAILAGLLAAAICTLRQNYISAAVGFVAIVHLALLWFPGEKRRQEWLRQGARAGLAIFVFLLPWMILSTIAIHSPFYPVVRGNVRPDFGMSGHVAFNDEVSWALTNLFMFTPVNTIALFFVAVFVLRPSRQNRAIQAFMLTNMVAFALMMHFFRAFHDAESIARYYFAFSVAFCLAATLRVLEDSPSWTLPKQTVVAVGLVALAVGYQVVTNKKTILDTAQVDLSELDDLVHMRGPIGRTALDDVYKRIQASVPPGEPILVMLDHTYLFDGRRNPIFNYDHPGTMGPKGGPPAFKGPEALAAYLHGLGIHYLAYQIGPTSREYDVGYWERMGANAVVSHGRGNFYKVQSRFELDTFTTFQALAASRRVVFSEGEIRVLDLDKRT
jgi:xanthosine utilization system XapX-like protein